MFSHRFGKAHNRYSGVGARPKLIELGAHMFVALGVAPTGADFQLLVIGPESSRALVAATAKDDRLVILVYEPSEFRMKDAVGLPHQADLHNEPSVANQPGQHFQSALLERICRSAEAGEKALNERRFVARGEQRRDVGLRQLFVHKQSDRRLCSYAPVEDARNEGAEARRRG